MKAEEQPEQEANGNQFSPNFRLPFNWKTPTAYLIAVSAQSIPIYCTLFCAQSVICFLIGSCWLIDSIVNDIASDLPQLNVGGASNRNENTKRLCCIVEFFMNAKQLSVECACEIHG